MLTTAQTNTLAYVKMVRANYHNIYKVINPQIHAPYLSVEDGKIPYLPGEVSVKGTKELLDSIVELPEDSPNMPLLLNYVSIYRKLILSHTPIKVIKKLVPLGTPNKVVGNMSDGAYRRYVENKLAELVSKNFKTSVTIIVSANGEVILANDKTQLKVSTRALLVKDITTETMLACIFIDCVNQVYNMVNKGEVYIDNPTFKSLILKILKPIASLVD